MTREVLAIGTPVSYEDMANPFRMGRVIQIKRSSPVPGVTYLVKWSDGSTGYYGCRGRHWRIGRIDHCDLGPTAGLKSGAAA